MHFFETALLPGQRLSLDGCDTPLPTLCQYFQLRHQMLVLQLSAQQRPTLISPAKRVLKPAVSNELISLTPLLPASKLL
jgi:hypothetical protein